MRFSIGALIGRGAKISELLWLSKARSRDEGGCVSEAEHKERVWDGGHDNVEVQLVRSSEWATSASCECRVVGA